jgi:hypothetical protein
VRRVEAIDSDYTRAQLGGLIQRRAADGAQTDHQHIRNLGHTRHDKPSGEFPTERQESTWHLAFGAKAPVNLLVAPGAVILTRDNAARNVASINLTDIAGWWKCAACSQKSRKESQFGGSFAAFG